MIDQIDLHHSSKRINLGGNFCGFSLEAPSYLGLIPEHTGSGSIPRVLTMAANRLAEYFDDPNVLPGLAASNGRQRTMRCERRDACLCLLLVCISNTDVLTLLVGRPKHRASTKILPYTITWLANKAGLPLRRAERALSDLVRAGILTISQRREKTADGQYRSQAAVKRVNPNLFVALGLKRMLSHAQSYMGKKLKRSHRHTTSSFEEEKEKAHFQMFTHGLFSQGGIKNPGIRRPNKPSRHQPELTERQRHEFLRLQGELMMEFPDLPVDDVNRIALEKASRA
jgi:hypothetical protein